MGVDILFYSVGISVRVTPITKGPPSQIFLDHMFFVPRLSFDLCYDLDIWTQGQALNACFVLISSPLFHQKYERDFDQTWQEASKAFGT